MEEELGKFLFILSYSYLFFIRLYVENYFQINNSIKIKLGQSTLKLELIDFNNYENIL